MNKIFAVVESILDVFSSLLRKLEIYAEEIELPQ